MTSLKKESDSELLELYNRQKGNSQSNNNPNSTNESSIIGNNGGSGYYKLVDNQLDDNYDPNRLTDRNNQDIEKNYIKKNFNSNFSNNYNNNSNNSNNSNNAPNEPRRPIAFNPESSRSPDPLNRHYEPTTPKLPPVQGSLQPLGDPYKSESMNLRSDSVNSQESYNSNAKKILKWNLWWEKPESNIRVPFSYIPEYKKKVGAKVGSLDKINHRPGGGNIQVVNEKQLWKKQSRVDHIKHDYEKRGGGIKILDQKSSWHTNAKIGSLENASYKPGGGNIQILQQPFTKTGKIKPRIDTGFVYEEMMVSNDYEVKPNLRCHNNLQSPRSRSPYSVRTHQFR